MSRENGNNSTQLSSAGPRRDDEPRRAEDSGTVSGVEANEATLDIKRLLGEFTCLYADRLRHIEDTGTRQEDTLRMKVRVFQSYVNDLAEQNQVLVQTIEDLEKEAHNKVSRLEMKLSCSGDTIDDLSHQRETLEWRVSALRSDNAYLRSGVNAPALLLRQTTHTRRNLDALGVESEDTHAEGPSRTRVSHAPVHLKAEVEDLLTLQLNNKELNILSVEKQVNRREPEEETGGGQTIRKRAENAVILNDQVSGSRQQLERQQQQQEEQMLELRQQREAAQLSEVNAHEERARRAEQEVQSLSGRLAEKEESIRQLFNHNTLLRDELQNSKCMHQDISQTLDQVRSTLDQEIQLRQQVQDQLSLTNQAVERLQQEVACVRRGAEKKILRREAKMCALLKELTRSKKNLSDCQTQLLSRQSVLERLHAERAQLRAKMEDRSTECVALRKTNEGLEKDLTLRNLKHRTEVGSRDECILQLRGEIQSSEQQHQVTLEKELFAVEAEVRRLNQKVRGQQEEACQLREKVREREELREQAESERQQIHDQLCITQQQVASQLKSIKRLNSDMEAAKDGHKVDAQRWSQRNFLLQSQLEQANSELSQSQARLKERESQVHELKERESHALIGQQEAAERVERQNATQRAQHQEETAAIFKQKYSVAMEKVQQVQGQLVSLEEELRYSQQQLKESQEATRSALAELAEQEGRYLEKVGQWETSEEALDQLTDELQANQNLLTESRERVSQCERAMATLQEQVDTLKQQKQLFQSDLLLYQQCHSHSDEEYLSLLRHRKQLQKSCTEQAECIAECEGTVLQLKTDLELQSQEKEGLERSLAASHHARLTNHSRLEQEVTRLKQEATRLEMQLGDAHKTSSQRERVLQMRDALLRRSGEDLQEARREAEVQREAVRNLEEEVQKEVRQRRSAVTKSHELSSHCTQLSLQLQQLRRQHTHTVEELAGRAEEEARRLAVRLSEERPELAEEKRRSEVEGLQREVTELKQVLEQAVEHRLEAQTDRQLLLEQVDVLRLELAGTRSDNTKLHRESQLVMANVNRWITEHKSSSDSLAAQVKAQNKVLLIITEEKEHLQQANDTLKEELKKGRNEEKEREMEHLKIQQRVQDTQHSANRDKERESCMALNLSRIEDMQTRLRSNLEAIGILNQKLSALSEENQRLRRQLRAERAARKRAERLLPPPPTQ